MANVISLYASKIKNEKNIKKELLGNVLVNRVASSADGNPLGIDRSGRGIQLQNLSDLMAMGGKNKQGNFESTQVQCPIFRVPVILRNELMKICVPLQGLISSRMNIISTTPFKIIPIRDKEDRIYDNFKNAFNIVKEYQNAVDPKYIQIRERMKQALLNELPDLLPDLSNFMNSILRWKKSIQNKHTQKAEEIEDWIRSPRNGVSYVDFIKKVVFDLHIHGEITP